MRALAFAVGALALILVIKVGRRSEAVEANSSSKKSSGSGPSSSPLKSGVPVAPGDLFAVLARRKTGDKSEVLIGSFHGDTNGLATKPVTHAVAKYRNEKAPGAELIIGMDANTYGKPAEDQQGLQDFADWLGENDLATVWGERPNNARHTTFNARTHLQPQLNKAALEEEKVAKGDKNLKDHIVVLKGSYNVAQVTRDNTGSRKYDESIVIPTLTFPSDHGVLTVALRRGPKNTKTMVTTWNVAAINNNPFEYWITAGTGYNNMLKKVGTFINEPGAGDVPVSEVFTHEMFKRLSSRMQSVTGWSSKLGWLEQRWEKDLAPRKIISQFMKDAAIGKKRLASMPDRVTNTISQRNRTLYRPTVINCFSGDLSTMDKWFDTWLAFFFDEVLDGGKTPVELLPTIKSKKYPAVTDEEEEHSKPLQLLAQGIFDAILVYMMNKRHASWPDLRRRMCASLNSGKDERTIKVLLKEYQSSEIICLQEAAGSLIDKALVSPLADRYHILTPAGFDRTRNQNSVIFLSKETWEGNAEEVTAAVMPEFAVKS